MNVFFERIEKMKEAMKQAGISVYIVPTADYHLSEYAAEYFGFRKWLSGFTGSAGTLVVTRTESALWADGRYFLQAERQLEGSGIRLMRMGNEGVPTLEEYLESVLQPGMTLAADGRCISVAEGRRYKMIAQRHDACFEYLRDLSAVVWTAGRPALPDGKIWELGVEWAGESRGSKIRRVREKLAEQGIKGQVLTSLDDIAWLLNLRGSDVPHNPVFLSYVLLTEKEVILYTDLSKVTDDLRKSTGDEIIYREYNRIYEDVKQLDGPVQTDLSRLNYALFQSIGTEKAAMANPETFMKAVKNETEVKNLKQAHLLDGIALTKFIYWLKKTVKEKEVTEWEATEQLEKLRRSHPHLLDLSFESIGAYNANAAMMHYSASKENAAVMKAEGMYLIDSGGQYYEGTTDVTRTIILGAIPERWKRDYTLVLKGHLRLAMARYLYGCRGTSLDILARGPLWDIGLDYKCGTGHGVGYLLNVHEAPNGFRWKVVPERNDSCVLEANMVTTDEPGVYIEGSHGIRIENELLGVNLEKNEYGQFMGFEILTLAPIDPLGIDPSLLSREELAYLNEYHKTVYEKLAPYMEEEERAWLMKECAPLGGSI